MNKEMDFINDKKLREDSINRIDVLDKVKDLLLLSNTEFATVEQVANYYEVGKEAITSLIHDNRDEIESDGYKVVKRSDINESFEIPLRKFKSTRGKTVITFLNGEEFNVTNTGMAIFPKRAILRVGMLLRDSQVAKEVRTKLLDITQDAESIKINNGNTIVQNVIGEIDEEKQLMLERISAEMEGNFDKVCVINAKLFALKNKRINELENEIDVIQTHALTISESRSVINKLVRKIAMTKYNSMFAKAYGDLYSHINTKLGINIKNRQKKKSESYLHTLSEEETYEVEQIVRSWANELEIDIDSVLDISIKSNRTKVS